MWCVSFGLDRRRRRRVGTGNRVDDYPVAGGAFAGSIDWISIFTERYSCRISRPGGTSNNRILTRRDCRTRRVFQWVAADLDVKLGEFESVHGRGERDGDRAPINLDCRGSDFRALGDIALSGAGVHFEFCAR